MRGMQKQEGFLAPVKASSTYVSSCSSSLLKSSITENRKFKKRQKKTCTWEWVPPWGLQKGMQAADNLILAQRNPYQTFDLQSQEIINFCFTKPQILQEFVIVTTERQHTKPQERLKEAKLIGGKEGQLFENRLEIWLKKKKRQDLAKIMQTYSSNARILG